MDGFGSTNFCGADNAIYAKIAVDRFCGPNTDRLIRTANVSGITVGLTKDGDGRNAHFFAGSNDSQGDFTTIGDEYSVIHARED